MNILRQILDGIAKSVAKVLVVVYLWIPALYSVVFFIILLMGNRGFEENKIFFWVGFCAFCLAAGLMLVIKGPNLKKSGDKSHKKEDKKNNKNDGLLSPLYGMNPNNTTNNQYIVLQNPQQNQQYVATPLVFASRVDPNMFIYEYHDRLELFKRDDRGMLHVGTEYKHTRVS